MSTTKLAASLLVLFAAAIISATPAGAETINCTHITSLPAVITVQGIYCFTGDLSTAMTSGNAIEIQTNNVTIDLNGFKLGGLAAGLGTETFGIHALNRQNITIKNGTIRGFLKGILLEDAGSSQGHVVEDIRADENTYTGIEVRGRGTIVRNNQVVTTGGTTSIGDNADAFGIILAGDAPRVLNNDVDHTFAQGLSGISRGIIFVSAIGGIAVNNRITSANLGIQFLGGSDGKFRDNITLNVNAPYTGGTDIGNNN